MKRSEMIKLMRQSLAKLHDRIMDESFFNDLCDVLLKASEEAGMLPPPKGNTAAFRTVVDEIDPTWEPEE